jgi:hypothetical protein
MRHLDNEQTSDEHILTIAKRKKHIIEQFENALKKASVDCLNNAENNATREAGLQCYVAPVDLHSPPGTPGAAASTDGLTFVPDIGDHQKNLLGKLEKRIRRTTVRGERQPDGNVRVSRDRRQTPYDLAAYVNAGVLVAKV